MSVTEDEIKAFSFNIWSYKQGEMVSMMIHLGDRLGIYKALVGAGPMTADQLADKTGYHPRWLQEWLLNQAAARILESEDGTTFSLPEAGAAVLADEENSLHFAAGAFAAPTHPDLIDRLAEAFRSGIGLSYEELGPSGAHRTERMLGPWARLALVPRIIPALDGIEDKLKNGAVACDVGCGGGLAIAALAAAFPASEFHGYDPSTHAIANARRKKEEQGLDNLHLHQGSGVDLPEGPTYDFVITFDCMHDMTRPDQTIAAIRRSLKPDGTWLIKDIKSFGDFRKNRKNPMLAMMYGFSVSACMSSALSEEGGMGLGTLGFHPQVAREMTRAGGFSGFVQHDFDDPTNFYYEVRI